MIIEKTVDMLTKDSVSILTKRFVEEGGQKLQVGENHRRAYVNSNSGREEIINNEPQDVVNSVIAIWGDTPTVEDLIIEEDQEEVVSE